MRMEETLARRGQEGHLRGHGRMLDLSVRQTWVWALTPQLAGCVVLDRLPDFTGAQFPCLSNKAYFPDS